MVAQAQCQRRAKSLSCIAGLGLRRRHVEQAAGSGDVVGARAAGKQTVVADAMILLSYMAASRQTPLDPFMKGAEWSAPGKLKPAA